MSAPSRPRAAPPQPGPTTKTTTATSHPEKQLRSADATNENRADAECGVAQLTLHRLGRRHETLAVGEPPQPARAVVTIMDQHEVRLVVLRPRDAELPQAHLLDRPAQRLQLLARIQHHRPATGHRDRVVALEIIAEKPRRPKRVLRVELRQITIDHLNKVYSPRQIGRQRQPAERDQHIVCGSHAPELSITPANRKTFVTLFSIAPPRRPAAA